MNLLFPSLGVASRSTRSSYLYPGMFFSGAPGEKALIQKASVISERVFGYLQECSISFYSRCNYSSTFSIGLHPVFSFTPDLVPKELLEKNITEFEAKRWMSEQFNENISTDAFSTSWKIFRWLAKKPAYYEGVRDFILAREIADLASETRSYEARYYEEVAPGRFPFLLSRYSHLAPLLPLLEGILSGSFFSIAVGVALFAVRIFFNWKEAKAEKDVLLKAVEATGDVKSAIIYYKLLRFYNPRRFDWIRRVTIDRLLGFHDPLRTLSSLPVSKELKRKDTFSDPFFARR